MRLNLLRSAIESINESRKGGVMTNDTERDITDPTDAPEDKMIVPDEQIEEVIRDEDIPAATGQDRVET